MKCSRCLRFPLSFLSRVSFAINPCSAFSFDQPHSQYCIARPRLNSSPQKLISFTTRCPSRGSIDFSVVYNMNTDIDNTSDKQNYQLAQHDHELFDIYPSPPTLSHYNSLITPEWGDTYFPSPNPTGITDTRRRIHREGHWHRSVQVWVVQRLSRGDNRHTIRVLLQRRSRYKDTHPNLLDVSCAGHVDAGENIVECALRELREELGGWSNVIEEYTHDDLVRSKAFVVTSSIQGETKHFGSFICNEYQDVFILWWKDDVLMEAHMFASINKTEVEGFEIIEGKDLIQRLRRGDDELVPHSIEYVDALARAFSLE